MADPAWLERPLPEELEIALRTSGRGGWSVVYPVEFSIVDAATMEYLPTLEPGFADDIQREQITLGSMRYTIADKDLGPLGALRLRRISDDQTEVTVEPPPQPSLRPPTDEEHAAAQAQPDKAAWYQALREIDKRRRVEQAAHWRWRQAAQAAIICGFIQRFEEEQGWLAKAAEGMPSPQLSAEARSRGRPRNDIYDEGYRIYYRNKHDARIAFETIKQRYPEAEGLDFERFRQAMLYRAANRGRRKRRKM